MKNQNFAFFEGLPIKKAFTFLHYDATIMLQEFTFLCYELANHVCLTTYFGHENSVIMD
jgi:hypothetical protein